MGKHASRRSRVTGGLRNPSEPDAERRLGFPPDYLDQFVLETDVEGRPSQWAIAVFEIGIDRMSRDIIFRRLLRMTTLPDGAPGTIAGWMVEVDTSSSARIVATGPDVTTALIVSRTPQGVSLTTGLTYHSNRGRRRWSWLSHIHRRVAARVLRHGENLMRARATRAENP